MLMPSTRTPIKANLKTTMQIEARRTPRTSVTLGLRPMTNLFQNGLSKATASLACIAEKSRSSRPLFQAKDNLSPNVNRSHQCKEFGQCPLAKQYAVSQTTIRQKV